MVKRRWFRALHRDIGYLCVGLTFVYALSGIAVNHIEDWDPNFQNYETQTVIADSLPNDEKAAARLVLTQLNISEQPIDIYRVDDLHFDIVLSNATVLVDQEKGVALEQGQRPRFLLRAANWLHLNRGKAAWTYVADAFAGSLLVLATTGMVMIPAKKGLLGRGGLFVLIGIAVPVLYVTLSGE